MGRKGTNELISGEKPFIAILSNLKCLFTRLYLTEGRKVEVCVRVRACAHVRVCGRV